MATYLPPIEKPDSLMMKLAYYFTRRQFGKVITPLKVHSARLPSAFGLFYAKIPKLDKKLVLAPGLVLLIRERVASIVAASAPHRYNRVEQSIFNKLEVGHARRSIELKQTPGAH